MFKEAIRFIKADTGIEGYYVIRVLKSFGKYLIYCYKGKKNKIWHGVMSIKFKHRDEIVRKIDTENCKKTIVSPSGTKVSINIPKEYRFIKD